MSKMLHLINDGMNGIRFKQKVGWKYLIIIFFSNKNRVAWASTTNQHKMAINGHFILEISLDINIESI